MRDFVVLDSADPSNGKYGISLSKCSFKAVGPIIFAPSTISSASGPNLGWSSLAQGDNPLATSVFIQGESRIEKGTPLCMKPPDRTSGAFIVTSLLCLGLLALIVGSPPGQSPVLQDGRQAIGVAFIIVCVLGSIATVRPSGCARILSLDVRAGNRDGGGLPSPRKQRPVRLGHHPSCQAFSSHVFRVGGRVYCAGCTGLLVGAAVAAVVGYLYFFVGLEPASSAAGLFWGGLLAVAFVLTRALFYDPSWAFIRVLLNLLFVMGSTSLLVGGYSLTNSAIALFGLVAIVYFIVARIVISRQDHMRICKSCPNADSCRELI
jgi:hypothetical protein